jgi:hypothetical protein
MTPFLFLHSSLICPKEEESGQVGGQEGAKKTLAVFPLPVCFLVLIQMNGNTSVSLSGSHANFQSNAVSLTKVAFAHPVLSVPVLKIASPKHLSLARCYQSGALCVRLEVGAPSGRCPE